MTVMAFGYLILISADFYDFKSPFSPFVSVLIERIYRKLKTKFDHISNTSKFFKNTLLRVVFLTLFSVFGNVVKRCCLCLTYHFHLSHMALNMTVLPELEDHIS